MLGVVSRTRAVRAAAVLTALASTLLVAGCGGDPEPKFAVPSETTSAPTPSPSETPAAAGPTEPTLPAAARSHDAAGAKAFVKFYWAMINYAQETGDVSGLESLAHKCVGCDAGVKFIKDSYRDGGSIRGGRGTVRTEDVAFIGREGKSWAVAEFLVTSTKQFVLDADGAELERFPGGTSRYRIFLEPTSDAWVIRILSVP